MATVARALSIARAAALSRASAGSATFAVAQSRALAAAQSRSRALSTAAVRSTAASGSQVYESKRAVSEYLLFHYGEESDMMPYAFGPTGALDFPRRLADLTAHAGGENKRRALDIGCAVGASSFQLARHYTEVVGIDFSQHFVDAANTMKDAGRMDYEVMQQGNIFLKRTAYVPPEIDVGRVSFQQGDATNLDSSLGQFDLILASNLLCRLPSPRKFIDSVSSFLSPKGTLLLVSPYSWLEEYTPVSEWFGGRVEAGEPLTSYTDIQSYIKDNGIPLVETHREDIPFLIREHERKFQYGVSDVVVLSKTE